MNAARFRMGSEADLAALSFKHLAYEAACLQLALKAETAEEHTTPQYIWRTQHDGHVRPEHAANDGKIFSWDNPPPTGHPGEAYGCRCWAEAYGEEGGEISSQTVMFSQVDKSPSWENTDFVYHYCYGEGETVSLSQIGCLQTIIDAAKSFPQKEGLSVFQRVMREVHALARQHGEGSFLYSFEQSYEFKEFIYSIGGATVLATGPVQVEDADEYLIVFADLAYSFRDIFTDPFSVQDGMAAINKVIGRQREKVPFTYSKPESHGDLPGGVPYFIIGGWSTRIESKIKKDES